MSSYRPAALRQLGAALRTLILLTVILGVVYPLGMTAIAQVFFSEHADGSLITVGGKVVGSRLIGQEFTTQVLKDGKPVLDSAGNPTYRPDPAYFQSRPSAAGTGYDPLSTSASNLGPENKDLIAAIEDRRRAAAQLDGVPAADVPPDALLASASGLDPQISPAYAAEQVARVARVRHLAVSRVRALVEDNTQGRILGFLGEPAVNVLTLNLSLDDLSD